MAKQKIDPKSNAIIFVPTPEEKLLVNQNKEMRERMAHIKSMEVEMEQKLKELSDRLNN